MQQLPPGLNGTGPGIQHQTPLFLIPWYRRRRVVVFLSTFFVLALIGLAFSYARPEIYRSSASLLSTTPSEINHLLQSDQFDSAISDTQHIAVQNEILTDRMLLEQVRQRLNKIDTSSIVRELSTSELSNMLSVTSVVNSNLIELNADSPYPAILPKLVNTWIEIYKEIRAENLSKSTGEAITTLNDQIVTLESNIADKRKQLDAFRQQNNILSNERGENQVLARLKGLNDSLNAAEDEELKTKARLEAVKTAIAKGQPVFLENSIDNDNRLAALEEAAQILRERQATLEQQYTPEYIQLVPDLKAVPDQLKVIEGKISKIGQNGQELILSDATQAYNAAKQKTRDLRRQLEEHKAIAGRFTTQFSQHQAFQDELQGLEKQYQSSKDKVLQANIKLHKKYPQIEVVRAAFLPDQPIAPSYMRDAGIILAGALLLALIAVLMIEFLSPDPQFSPSGITLSGVHMYPDAQTGQLPLPPQVAQLNNPDTVASLEMPAPRELRPDELSKLWQQAPAKGKQLISMLLSGIHIDEAVALSEQNFNLEDNTIQIPGKFTRTLSLSPILKALVSTSGNAPLWQNSEIAFEDLSAFLTCLAADADIKNHDEIDATVLHHTYLCFLVRQGAKLSEMENIIGYLSPASLNLYRKFSPPGPGRSLDDLDLVFPINTIG